MARIIPITVLALILGSAAAGQDKNPQPPVKPGGPPEPAAIPRPGGPDPVLVAASADIDLLAADQAGAKGPPPPPLTTARWAARQTAVNRWMAFKLARETAGVEWPKPREVNWPATPFQPSGLTPDDLGRVEQLILSAKYATAWDQLWSGTEVPEEWKDIKAVLTEPGPNPDETTRAQLDRWAAQLERVRATTQLPPPLPGPSLPGGPLPGGPGGPGRRPAAVSLRFAVGGGKEPVTVKGPLVAFAEDWNGLVRQQFLATRSTRPDVPGPDPKVPPTKAAWASPTKDALGHCDALIAHFKALLAPAEPAKTVSDEIVERFNRHVGQIRTPIEELHTVLTLRDEFPARYKAAGEASEASLRNTRKGISDLIAPVADPKAKPDESQTRKLVASEWDKFRAGLWKLAVLRRQAIDHDARFKAAAQGWQDALIRCRRAFQDEVGEALGTRLGFEVREWDKRNLVQTTDLRERLQKANPAAAKALVDSVSSFYLANPPMIVRIAPDRVHPVQQDSGELNPCLISQEVLGQFVARLLPPPAAPENVPLLIDLRGHRLAFNGIIELPFKVGDKPRPTTLLVMANEVDLAGAEWHIGPGCKVCVVAHRVTANPLTPGAAPIPPLVAVTGDGRFEVFVSFPASSPDLVHLAGPAPQMVFTTAGPKEITWESLVTNTKDEIRTEIARFGWSVRDDLLNRFVDNQMLSEDTQRIALQDVLAIPRVVVPNNTDLERQQQRLNDNTRRLFDSRVLVLTDLPAGAGYPCLSRFVSGQQEISLLPDALELVPQVGAAEKLGEVVIDGGQSQFTFTVRPVVSGLANTRGRQLVRVRFPNAVVTDMLWRDHALTWPDEPRLAGLPLKPPVGKAWDVNQQPSRFTLGPLDSAGLARFAPALTAARVPTAENRLRVVLTEGKRRIGEYDLTLNFEQFGPPPGQPSSVLAKFKPGSVEVTNGYGSLPVYLSRVFSADEVGRASPAERAVPPGKTQTFTVEGMSKEGQAEIQLDLTGKHPFEVFSLGQGLGARTMTAKLQGLWSARFPDGNGAPGTGEYIDLGRSRLQVRYSNPEQLPPQEFPGPSLTLERLAQWHPDLTYRYPVYGNYKSVMVLELYRAGGERNSTVLLELPLPGENNTDTLDLSDYKVAEAKLSEKSKKP